MPINPNYDSRIVNPGTIRNYQNKNDIGEDNLDYSVTQLKCPNN